MKVLTARAVVWQLSLLAGLLLAALSLGVCAGPSEPHGAAALRALFSGEESAAADIVLRVRLPRVLLAAVVGAALAAAGALFQALLRNPLADPYVLGVSGGAAVGGILALSFGPALGLGAQAVPPAAFAGALVTTAVLYAVAGVRGRVSATHLLLTGVVFNAFASAGIVFVASLAGLSEGTSLFLWLIGSLSSVRADAAPVVAAFLVLGLGCALPLLRDLNLLSLGEESAQQLGVEVARLQRVLLLSTSLMVGAAVAVAGLVGFVGLIVPHLLRLRLGPDHRLLVPAAALGGAAFLVVCDTAARTLFGGRELPVGAITALAGGPLFLYLLRRHHLRELCAVSAALAFEDVALRLGGREVLTGVSLVLEAGEVLGIAGPNGAGKTTLFRVATRVLRAERGAVRIGGDPIESLSRRALARRIAVVPQDVGVPFPFRAGEVVLMGRSPHGAGAGFESETDVARALDCLASVGIEALADRSMQELSGGERQLVLVARALAQEPDVLLLDEPTAHLDLRHRTVVLDRVRDFAARGGAAVVVSHDLTLSARTCHRLALLFDGAVCACGTPSEVLRPELLQRVFGVDAQVLEAPDGAPLVVPQRPSAG